MEKVAVSLVPEGSSYYVVMDVQMSAAEGPERHKIDRELGKLAAKFIKSGGRGSSPEMAEFVEALKDANRIGAGEQVLIDMFKSACDGRKSVTFSGAPVRLTDAAKRTFLSKLAAFEGELGCRSRALRDGVDRVKPNPYIGQV